MEKKQEKNKNTHPFANKNFNQKGLIIGIQCKKPQPEGVENFAPGDHWEDHQQETPPSNKRPVVSQQLFFCYPVVRPSQGATVDGNQKSQGPHRVDV